MSIVEQAKHFATVHHGDQTYGNNLPHTYHLNMVAEVVKEFQLKVDDFDTTSAGYAAMYQETLNKVEHYQAAAWLHDVIEDTPITFEQVFEEFGRHIARLVFAVTNEEGKNRRERHARTYPKLRAAGREAMIIKLSDRIVNIRHSVQHNHGMVMMYKKEYPHFREYLKVPGELKSMCSHIILNSNNG